MPAGLGEAAIVATLRHLSLPYYQMARCFSASSWIHREHLHLREEASPLVARARRAASFRLCRACLRGGRFRNHYGLCRRCRPVHKPEVRRRFLVHTLRMPQLLVSMLPRRPGTRQYPVALDDVWDLFEEEEEQGSRKGRAWRRRMREYPSREAFIDACSDAVIMAQ